MHSSLFTSIHILPAACFDEGASVTLDKVWRDDALFKRLQSWLPADHWKRESWKLQKRFNNDGLLLFEDHDSSFQNQYIQFYESGIIEAVDGLVAHAALTSRLISGTSFEKGILDILAPLLDSLKTMDAAAPVAICVSLRLPESTAVFYGNDKLIDQKTKEAHSLSTPKEQWPLVTLPLTILHDYGEELAVVMKLCFNRLARAAGYPGSPRYSK